MKYRLIYTRRALRDIDGLDDLTRKRIAKALARYEGDPLKHAESMTDSRIGSYRFRIGDYPNACDDRKTCPRIMKSKSLPETRTPRTSRRRTIFRHFHNSAGTSTIDPV